MKKKKSERGRERERKGGIETASNERFRRDKKTAIGPWSASRRVL